MEGAAAVHVGRLFQARGDAFEVLPHHVDVEAVLQAHAGQAHDHVSRYVGAQVQRRSRHQGDQARSGAVHHAQQTFPEGQSFRVHAEQREDPQHVEVGKVHVQGRLDGLRRDDDDRDDAGEPEFLQREFIPGEPVGDQRGRNDLAHGYQQGDPQRVSHGVEGPRAADLLQVGQFRHDPVVVQRHVPREQDDGGIVQVPFLHQAHQEAGQQRLEDHEAQAEHQQAADDGQRGMTERALQQVASAAPVPVPEAFVLADENRIILTHCADFTALEIMKELIRIKASATPK